MQFFLEWWRWINKVGPVPREIFNVSNRSFNQNKSFILPYKEGFVRKMIWGFKFYNRKKDYDTAAQIFSDEIIYMLFESMCFSNKKILIVPVPSDPMRFLTRGFGHMEKICKKMCLINSGLFIYKKAINKKHKKRQVGLSKQDRLNNLENSFYLKKSLTIKENDHAFILDDILTTGTTAKECLKVLDKEKCFVNFLALASNKE